MPKIFEIDAISQAHQSVGLPAPKHPLVSIVYAKHFRPTLNFQNVKVKYAFYQVSFKQSGCGNVRYGKNSYDYEEGTLLFSAPGQVTTFEDEFPKDPSLLEDWTLAFHPNLIRKSAFVDKIDQYSFFHYDISEALHISQDERKTIEEILDKIIKEYSQNLDRHSQNLIVSNIELLLDYCLRFYERQFYTRTNLNSDIVSKFERLLKDYYKSEMITKLGVPSVSYCAKKMKLSTNYLSDLLKKETGKTTQEHIHIFVIDKAKNSLLNSTKSISEIGYELGFEYHQHFSNLFKSKTGMSPSEFRSLN